MSITHVEPDFRVPYPRFRVSVGIMVGGVVSPLDNIMQSYGECVCVCVCVS